jgi:hypothetical protein
MTRMGGAIKGRYTKGEKEEGAGRGGQAQIEGDTHTHRIFETQMHP